MNKYAIEIMNKLINKYERSLNYRQSVSGRRVILNFNEKELPRYSERKTAEPRNMYNEASRWLEQMDFIKIEWEKYLENQVIQRVVLNEVKSAEVYAYLRRTPLRVKEVALITLLRSITIDEAWLVSFREFIITRLEEGKSIASYFDLNDIEKNKLIITSLVEISRLQQEVPKRVFSSRFLGNSKAFASIEARIAKVLQEFYFVDEEYKLVEKDDMLAELGLVDNPQYVYISGGVTISFRSNLMYLGNCAPGIALPALWLNEVEVKNVTAKRIVTIENLTTFHQYALKVKGEEVVLYLGGYHNKVRLQILLKLVQSSEIPVYHWGDIDAGGYDILRNLRKQSGINVHAMWMDSRTLDKYSHLAQPLDKNSIKKLQTICKCSYMNDVKNEIERILGLGIKLEQEAIRI